VTLIFGQGGGIKSAFVSALKKIDFELKESRDFLKKSKAILFVY